MKAEEKCYKITGKFEGIGGFSNLTGNFDNMGVSFGILQWNFGQGTLHGLIKEFYKNGPQTFRKCCTVNGVDYSNVLLSACNMSPARAVEWAKTIQSTRNAITPAWATIFIRLGENKVYQNIQMRFAETGPMARAKKDMESFGLNSERALALFFDIAVQNGGIRPAHRLLIDKNKTGKELLANIAQAVASCAIKRFQNDVLSRKMCIVNGSGKVHGVLYNLDKDFDLTDDPVK